MASAGTAGRGTLIQIGDGGGPETFTTIAEVQDIQGPGLALDQIEMTNQSTPGGWEEFVGGILRTGEITFAVNFIPTHATQSYSAGLVRDMVNRTVRNFKLVFPNTAATTWAFAAIVSQFQPNAPLNDRLSADVTLKLTGQPTLA